MLKDYGANAIVASICPKVVDSPNPATDPNYGYNPAVGAIITRLKEALTGKCLPRALVPEANPDAENYGQVPCAVIEATSTKAARATAVSQVALFPPTKSARPCSRTSRRLASAAARPARTATRCACARITQLSGDQLTACQNNPTVTDPNLVGYCYIDEAQGIGNADIVAKCPSTQRRILRFVGPVEQHAAEGRRDVHRVPRRDAGSAGNGRRHDDQPVRSLHRTA